MRPPLTYTYDTEPVFYETKDSGDRQEFGNGSVRDTNSRKPRPDLISTRGTLRHAELMARGAEKYGDRNWELGQPVSRFLESLERHLLSYKLGRRDEDHLAAIRFNVDGVMHFEGTEWDDVNGGAGKARSAVDELAIPPIQQHEEDAAIMDLWGD